MLPGMMPRSPSPRAHRALARHQHVRRRSGLARDVVVVAVHRLARRHRKAAAEHRARAPRRTASIISSRFSQGVVLRPLDRLDVVVEVLACPPGGTRGPGRAA